MKKKTKRIVAVLLAFAIILQQDGLAGMTMDGSALADEILQEEALEPEIIEDTPEVIAAESLADPAAEGQADPGTDAAENSAEPQLTVSEVVPVDSAEEALPEGEASLSEEQSSLSGEGSVLPALKLDNSAQIAAGAQVSSVALELSRPDGFPENATWKMETLKVEEIAGLTAGTAMNRAEGLALRFSADLNGSACDISGTTAVLDGLDASYLTGGHLSLCRDADAAGESESNESVESGELDEPGDSASDPGVSAVSDMSGADKWEELAVQFSQNGDSVRASFSVDSDGVLFFWKDADAETEEADGEPTGAETVVEAESETETEAETDIEQGNEPETEAEIALESESAENESETESGSETRAESETESETELDELAYDLVDLSSDGLMQIGADGMTETDQVYEIYYVKDKELVFQNDGVPDSTKDDLKKDIDYFVYNDDGTNALQAKAEDNDKWAFHRHSDTIESVKFRDVVSLKTLQYIFMGFKHLKKIDFGDFKVHSGMESVAQAFNGCEELTSLDLNNWDMSTVNNIGHMFRDCKALTELKIDKWNTEHVTNVYRTFRGCISLQTIDVKNWKTSAVTNMQETFFGCTALTELDLSNWDTKDANMSQLFSSCTSLSQLKLGEKFVFKSGTSLNGSWMREKTRESYTVDQLISSYNNDYNSGMAGIYHKLITITFKANGGSSDSTIDSYVGDVLTDEEFAEIPTPTRAGYVFDGWWTMPGDGEGEKLTAENSTIKQTTYYAHWKDCVVYEVLYDSGELVFQSNEPDTSVAGFVKSYTDDGSNAENSNNGGHGWDFYTDRERITSVTFKDNVQLKSLRGIFFGYPKLETIDVGLYDASGVSNMSSVFRECPKLETLNLRDWKLSSATTISNMFQDCIGLKSITGIEDWDISNVDNMNSIFLNCHALTTVNLRNWRIKETGSIYMKDMFSGCDALDTLILGENFRFRAKDTALTGNWKRQSNDDVYTATELMNLYSADMADTYVRVKVYEILYKNGELAFQSSEPDRSAVNIVAVYEDDGSNAGNNTWAFHDNKDLIKSVTFRDNVRLLSLRSIFRDCKNLVKVDIGEYTASGVTDMGYAFSGCENLTSLNLNTFDTSSVTYMGYIFLNCSNLRFLNVSSWNTGNVDNLYQTFMNCSSLKTLDVSRWDTAWVKNMLETFRGCNSLKELDLSGWSTAQVSASNMRDLFTDCKVLSRLILNDSFKFVSSYNAGLTGLWQKEGTEDIYTAEDLMKNSAEGQGTFVRLRVYEILYESGEMVIQNNDTPDSSKGEVYQIYEDDGINANDASCSWAFDEDKDRITSVTFGDNVKLRSLRGIFWNCTNLTTVDTTRYDASGVANIGSAFRECKSLVSVDLSNWDLSSATNLSNMFQGCDALTSVEGMSTWNTANVWNMNEMFEECHSFTSLDLSGWDTNKVTGMWKMFLNDSALVKLVLGSKFHFGAQNTELTGEWLKESTGEDNGRIYTAAELMNQEKGTLAGSYYRMVRITFNGNGGAASPQSIEGYLDMQINELPTAIWEGHYFDGWFTERVGGTQLEAGRNASELTYYAHWRPYEYKLRLHPQTGNSESGEPQNPIIEKELTFDEFYQLSDGLFKNEDETKFLLGWNTRSDGEGTMYEPNARVSGLADQDGSTVTLYAIWGDLDDYATLSFDPLGGSSVPPMRVKKGETMNQELPQSQREGYRFLYWSKDPDARTGSVNGYNLKITEDTTLYAIWEEYLEAVFDPNMEGLEPVTLQTTSREPLKGTLPKYPQREDGRTLIGWFTDRTGGEQVVLGETTLTEDTTFYAHWGWRPQFDTAGGKFTKNADGRYVEEDSHYTFDKLPEVTRDGYEFVAWFRETVAADGTITEEQVTAGTSLDLKDGTRIVAHWRKMEQVVVALDAAGGTMSGKENLTLSAYKGKSLGDLPIPEREGYMFLGWYDETGTTLYDRNTELKGNTKLVAQWAEAVYVTFMDDEVVKRLSVAKGGTIPSIPGAKKDNYILEGWYTDLEDKATKLTSETKITEDTVYYAKWREQYEEGNFGGSIYTYGIEWSSASNENVDNMDDRLIFHPTDYREQTASLHVHFQVNTGSNVKAIPAGAVEIKIPKSVWQDWEGKWTGECNLGDSLREPEEEKKLDGSNTRYFTYKDGGEYYVLYNDIEIPGGAGMDATFSYTVSPGDVPGGGIDAAGNYVTGEDAVSDKNIEFYQNTFPETGITVDTDKNDGKADTGYKKNLSIEMHTRVRTFASKEFSKVLYSWQSEWGDRPEDADDYFYIEWKLKETVESTTNQPFTFTWSEDKTVHDGTVVCFTQNDGEDVTPSGYKTYYNNQKVIVKYPLSMLKDPVRVKDGKLNIHNEAIVTEDWKSGYQTSHRVSANYTLEVPTSTGGEYGFEKYSFDTKNNANVHAPAQKHGGQEDIVDDNKEVSLGWRISYGGGPEAVPEWDEESGSYSTPERTIVITDGTEGNLMYSSGSADGKYQWKPTPENTVLSDEDYRIVSVKIDLTEYDAERLKEGTWTGRKEHTNTADYKDVDVYVRYKDSDDLVFFKRVKDGGEVYLPEDVRGVQILHESSFYWTDIKVNLTVNLLPSTTVRQLLRRDMAMNTTSIIKNFARCQVWTDGKAGEPYVNATDYNEAGSATREVWELDVSDTYQYLCKSAASKTKTVVDVRHGIQDTPMCLTGWLYNNSGRIKQLRTGIFYDLLPMGTTVDPSSVYGVWFAGNQWGDPGAPAKSGAPANSYTTKLTDKNRLPGSAYDVEFKDNWEDSKRTMMIVRFTIPESVKANGIHIYYLLRTTYENIMENGSTQENDAAFVNTSELSAIPDKTGAALSVIEEKGYFKKLDEQYSGTICYSEDSPNYAPIDVSTWGFDKQVKAETGVSYGQKATSLLNNLYTYRLIYSQGSGTRTKNIVFFDVLEDGFFEKAEGVPGGRKPVASDWTGSFVNLNIESLKKNWMDENDPGTACNPVVYYSTKPRESFDKNVGPNLEAEGVWQTEKPADEEITAIAVDCSMCVDGKTPFELKGDVDAMEIYITMRAPKSVDVAKDTARNRAAVYMTHIDSEEQETAVMMDAGASVTLKDVEPRLQKTSEPGSGTEDKPATVYKDDPLTYTLSVTNVNKELPLKNIILKDEIPEGLSVQDKDIRVRFGDDKVALEVKDSPRVEFQRDERKLEFMIRNLYAGETAYVEITGTVTAECTTAADGTVTKPRLENQAHIPSVNDVHKDLESDITYHEVQPIGFNISKTGVGGKPLVGATLELWKKNDAADANSPLEAPYYTLIEQWDSKGTVKEFGNLKEAGTYVIHEVLPPAGHLLAEDITVELDSHGNLKLDGKVVHGVTMHDDYTRVRVEKKDRDGNAVAGAELEIYKIEDFDMSGTKKPLAGKEPVAAWTTGDGPYELDGILDPSPESYVLYEKRAPEGYREAEPVGFSLGDGGSLMSLEMEDPFASFEVRVRKEDPNGKPLAKARLRITGHKDNGEEIDEIEWDTTVDDYVVKLYPGTYTLSEVFAPDGYAVADPIEFKVEEDTETNQGIVKVDGKIVDAAMLVMTDKRTQDLTVTKTVRGTEPTEASGGTKQYEFSLKLTRPDGTLFTETLVYEIHGGSGTEPGGTPGGGTGESTGSGTGSGTGSAVLTNTPTLEGVYEFSLAGGESITFLDVPQDLSYVVTEKPEEGAKYVVTAESDTGTTGAETPTKVKITNTYPNDGDLLITKTVLGSWAPKGAKYEVEITPEDGKTVNGDEQLDKIKVYKLSSGSATGTELMESPDVEITQSKITVMLSGGEQIKVEKLAPGTYTVKETTSTSAGKTVFKKEYSVDGGEKTESETASVKISNNKAGSVEVRNSYEDIGELEIGKNVEGDTAPENWEDTWYDVQVSATTPGTFRKLGEARSYSMDGVTGTSGGSTGSSGGGTGEASPGEKQFRSERVVNGVLCFQLRRGSKVKISGLPTGTYTVTETGAGTEDSYTASYTVTVKGSTHASSTSRGTVTLGGETSRGEIQILNRYPDKISMTLAGTKAVIGKELEIGKYHFTIEAVANPGNGASLTGSAATATTSGATVTVANSGTEGNQINFGTIVFTKAGTYVFRVKETKSDDIEVAKDGTVYTVTVTVETNEEYACEITKVVIAKTAAGSGTAETVATYEKSFDGGSGGSSGSEESGGSASEGDPLIVGEDVKPIPEDNAFNLPEQDAEDGAGKAVEATFINRKKDPLEMPDTGGPGAAPLIRTSIFLCLAGCFILLLAKRRKPRGSQ